VINYLRIQESGKRNQVVEGKKKLNLKVMNMSPEVERKPISPQSLIL